MNIRCQHGFNLLELMVGISVLGILLAFGVPSFTAMIRTNRLVEQSNGMVGALNYARSEALKRGYRVSACPGSSGACSGGTDWNAGVLVFTDDTGTTGTIDDSDEVLQSCPLPTASLRAAAAVQRPSRSCPPARWLRRRSTFTSPAARVRTCGGSASPSPDESA